MSDGEWLADDQQRTWRAFRGMHRLLMDTLERQLQADSGMPLSYYEVLVHLCEAPQRTLRMSRLAERCGSLPSSLSHAAARLEKANWIRRRASAIDGRGILCELTDAGLAALQAAAPGHVAAVRANLFAQITTEQASQLRAICSAITPSLGSDAMPPPARRRSS